MFYQRTYAKIRFSQDRLAEYAGYEMDGILLFRTVGIGHSFYRPASAVQFAHYARQVPEDFRFCSKVWEEITIPAFANLPRYGAKAGKPNSRLLDTGAFRDFGVGAGTRELGSKLGPFIFELQRWGMEPAAFLESLDRFLGTCHQDYPAILGSRYLNTLCTHHVSHVYNHLDSHATTLRPTSPAPVDIYHPPMSLSSSSRRWDSTSRMIHDDSSAPRRRGSPRARVRHIYAGTP